MDPLFALTAEVALALVRLRRARSRFDFEDPPWIVRFRLEPLAQSVEAVVKTLDDLGERFPTSIGALPPASAKQDVEEALFSVRAASLFTPRASDVLRERGHHEHAWEIQAEMTKSIEAADKLRQADWPSAMEPRTSGDEGG